MRKMTISVGGKTIAEVPYNESDETLTKSTFSNDIVTAVIGEVSATEVDGFDNWIEVEIPEKTYKVWFHGDVPVWAGIGKRVKVDMVTGTIEPIKAKEVEK